MTAIARQAVVTLLPEEYHRRITESEVQAKSPYSSLGANPVQLPNRFPAAVVIGIIVALGGMFVLLAAHQIVPQAANALSDLGIWGQVIGYGVLGVGVILALVGAVKTCQRHMRNGRVEERHAALNEARFNAETEAILQYFPPILDDKYLAVAEGPHLDVVWKTGKALTFGKSLKEVCDECQFDSPTFVDLAELKELASPSEELKKQQ